MRTTYYSGICRILDNETVDSIWRKREGETNLGLPGADFRGLFKSDSLHCTDSFHIAFMFFTVEFFLQLAMYFRWRSHRLDWFIDVVFLPAIWSSFHFSWSVYILPASAYCSARSGFWLTLSRIFFNCSCVLLQTLRSAASFSSSILQPSSTRLLANRQSCTTRGIVLAIDCKKLDWPDIRNYAIATSGSRSSSPEGST